MRLAVVLAMLLAAAAAKASADPITLQTGTAPVLNIVMQSGSITIKTWNREIVQVDAGAGVSAQHIDANVVGGRIPRQIPAWSQTVKTQRGDATLPAEVWIVPPLSATPHDAVIVRGDGDATITIPEGTAFVVARTAGQGEIDLSGYRGGAFFLSARAGAITLHDVAGTGFVQTIRGPIRAEGSSFDRIRVRNAIGQISFSECASQQIEVTSVFGSIVYDNGTFTPGLARFESQDGDVALGLGGNAEIGAHSTTGNVATEFTGRANVTGRGGDARASVGSGGPAVTASSGSGTILLYDGSIRDHASLVRRAPNLRVGAFANRPAGYHPAGNRPAANRPAGNRPAPFKAPLKARRGGRPPYRV